MTADQIRSALSCGRQGCECSKSGVKTHCPGPSHGNGDRHPSLGVNEKDGKVLVKCYGGCDQAAVMAELQGRGLWPRPEDREQSSSRREPTRIVATYDYRDGSGGLSFQVVRMEPKDFRQRRPKKGGGWEWKAGDRSIVYRLPELLAASDDLIVFVPEGEKDTDRLISLGLVATTNAGGGKKWSDGNSQWLAGRRVALLADNDVTGAEDVKRKLASLRPIAAAVAVVPLDGLPVAGDISDWLDAGGTKARLVDLAEAALSAAAPVEVRPVPPPALAPFPVHVLPASMRGLITSGARAMEVPAEFVAVPLLVLAGTAIGNAWEMEIKGGWREGPNLYAAIVGDPGAKKTPALKLALKAIHQIQARLYGEYRAAKAAYDDEMALWEKAPKKERGAPPEQPKFSHVWTSDSTTEALAEMLSGAKGLVLFRDELVGWVKSMDAYRSGGKGADRQHYLSMWSRSPIKIDRKSRPDPVIVDRPCLSVVGGIQPDVLPDLVEHASRDDGFIDRLLFAYPDIGPDRWTDAGVDEAAQAAVERLFSDLYDLTGAETPDGDVLPRVARLETEARTLWREWYDENAEEHRDEKLPSSLKGTWAKLPSQLARLALILHIGHAVDAAQAVRPMVSAETLAEAIVLVDYFKTHTRAVLGELRQPRSQLEDRVLRGLAEHGPSTTRTVQTEILANAVKYDRVKTTLERLLEDGSVTVADRASTGKGGRPGRVWAVTEAGEAMAQANNRSRVKAPSVSVAFRTQGTG
jgi:hypothetical protein